ncbi:shikimate dehydrogenase [Conyzicola nivalis]|uniref:Shikimate 5-dehydrogenase n=1 Tax=Conyzicola nivalis TaxID=1477021 RepID=A0A916SGP6_9MICO|nr:shikimate dehydrogenase [Conyzicola nivalis]GGA96578.1 shikimate 5-dehydrogenase [Conyzicola nivalis]
MTRLAVLGSPIAHSKSPLLHAAAYRALGLDWQYDAVDVTEGALHGFVAGRDASWRGLSLTMPLKRDVLPLLDWADDTATLTRAANTVLFDRSTGALQLRGYNTDVYGVTEAFREAGVGGLDSVEILGGGATAASALVAAGELGASRAIVSVRTPAKAADLVALGELLGVEVAVRQFGAPDRPFAVPDAVVSTIPGHGAHGLAFAEPIRAASVLFDVAYDPWPSELAASWLAAGGTVISGLEMLLHQAVAQIRIFVNGAPDATLPGEDDVLAAMRAAVAG